MAAGFSCHGRREPWNFSGEKAKLTSGTSGPQKVAATRCGFRNKHHLPGSGSVVTAFAGVPLNLKRGKRNLKRGHSELAETDTRGQVTLTCSSNLAAAAIFHFPASKLGSGTRILLFFFLIKHLAFISKHRHHRQMFLAVPESRCVVFLRDLSAAATKSQLQHSSQLSAGIFRPFENSRGLFAEIFSDRARTKGRRQQRKMRQKGAEYSHG